MYHVFTRCLLSTCIVLLVAGCGPTTAKKDSNDLEETRVVSVSGVAQTHVTVPSVPFGNVQLPVSMLSGTPTKDVGGVLGRIRARMTDDELHTEALQYGVTVSSSKISLYKLIRERILENEVLTEALAIAKAQDVTVYLEETSSVNTLYLDINVHATDVEIINFLRVEIPNVVRTELEYNALWAEAEGYGIQLQTKYVDHYKRFVPTLQAHPELVAIFKQAQASGVTVYAEDSFDTNNESYVNVNVDATPEAIIEFLVGKEE